MKEGWKDEGKSQEKINLTEDHFIAGEILGYSRDDLQNLFKNKKSKEDIDAKLKAKYRKLTFKYHPDKKKVLTDDDKELWDKIIDLKESEQVNINRIFAAISHSYNFLIGGEKKFSNPCKNSDAGDGQDGEKDQPEPEEDLSEEEKKALKADLFYYFDKINSEMDLTAKEWDDAFNKGVLAMQVCGDDEITIKYATSIVGVYLGGAVANIDSLEKDAQENILNQSPEILTEVFNLTQDIELKKKILTSFLELSSFDVGRNDLVEIIIEITKSFKKEKIEFDQSKVDSWINSFITKNDFEDALNFILNVNEFISNDIIIINWFNFLSSDEKTIAKKRLGSNFILSGIEAIKEELKRKSKVDFSETKKKIEAIIKKTKKLLEERKGKIEKIKLHNEKYYDVIFGVKDEVRSERHPYYKPEGADGVEYEKIGKAINNIRDGKFKKFYYISKSNRPLVFAYQKKTVGVCSDEENPTLKENREKIESEKTKLKSKIRQFKEMLRGYKQDVEKYLENKKDCIEREANNEFIKKFGEIIGKKIKMKKSQYKVLIGINELKKILNLTNADFAYSHLDIEEKYGEIKTSLKFLPFRYRVFPLFYDKKIKLLKAEAKKYDSGKFLPLTFKVDEGKDGKFVFKSAFNRPNFFYTNGGGEYLLDSDKVNHDSFSTFKINTKAGILKILSKIKEDIEEEIEKENQIIEGELDDAENKYKEVKKVSKIKSEIIYDINTLESLEVETRFLKKSKIFYFKNKDEQLAALNKLKEKTSETAIKCREII